VSANHPIPLDAFATAVESLDSDGLAALVGETYAATADDVAVDAPRVTVTEGGRRTDLFVVSHTEQSVPDASVDAVVVASDSPLDDGAAESGAEVLTPADLRQRLLYAVSPAEANAIAERLLGVPVRSAAYDATDGDTGSVDGDTGSVDGDDVDAADGGGDTPGADDDAVDGDGATPAVPPESDFSRGARSTGRDAADPVTDSPPRDRPDGSADVGRPSDGGPTGESADAQSDRPRRRTVVAAVVVVALLAAAAGAGFVAGAAGVGGPGGVAGVGENGTSDPSPGGPNATGPNATGPTDGTDGGAATAGDGGVNSVAVAGADPTGEADRNTALRPTCDRSALQVVQIQLNALRYNDNATNDGVRTLRAFASPANTGAVGSVDEYAALFETARYAPMLTYDTAQYSVPEITDGTAEIEVVTRENGSVTGRYEFRLVRVSGGSGDTDTSLGDVDDCWMTDAVTASTE
jgi:hypothetical protein